MSGWSQTGTGAPSAAPRADKPAGDGNVLSVTQALEITKGMLNGISGITVLGEVSGFRGPSRGSGHCYFQIKDENCSMECRVWNGIYSKSRYKLENGQLMQFTGNFDVYLKKGEMSFIARSFRPVGEGFLRQQVDALAKKLEREGLMDASRKRRIPVFCTRIAVVTSATGAVINDVKRTLRRRNPFVEVICVDSKVQGEGAAPELVEALSRAAAIEPKVDCILLVRGGGSYEDLMTFNDEALARAVAACPVPVVTGIGHESDNSICDMVSDRRASTPTAAAESIAPSVDELAAALDAREKRLTAHASATVSGERAQLLAALDRMGRAWDRTVERRELALKLLSGRPCMQGPGALVESRLHELDMSADRLLASEERLVERLSQGFDRLKVRFPDGEAILGGRRRDLETAQAGLGRGAKAITAERRARLGALASSLEALSPLKVLARGYAIAYADSGVASSVAAFSPGDAIRVVLSDGSVTGTVTEVSRTEGASGKAPVD